MGARDRGEARRARGALLGGRTTGWIFFGTTVNLTARPEGKAGVGELVLMRERQRFPRWWNCLRGRHGIGHGQAQGDCEGAGAGGGGSAAAHRRRGEGNSAEARPGRLDRRMSGSSHLRVNDARVDWYGKWLARIDVGS
jgi:hypothetical protein